MEKVIKYNCKVWFKPQINERMYTKMAYSKFAKRYDFETVKDEVELAHHR